MTFTIPNRSTLVNQHQTLWFQADVDALAGGIAGNGVRSGCAVTWTSGNDLAVASGSVSINGSTVSVTGTPLTVFQANGSMHRIDLVVVDTTGTVSLVRGQSVSLTPIAPDLPANSLLLAQVFVPAGSVALDASRIVDKRLFPATASASSSGGSSLAITALSGDGTAMGPGAVTFTLSTTAVTAGTYGDATHVAQVTVDAKGRVTQAANVAISGVGGGWTLLDTQTVTNSSVLEFINQLSTVYDNYVVLLNGVLPSTWAQDILMRVGTSTGTWDTSSNYGYAVASINNNSATSNDGGWRLDSMRLIQSLHNDATFGGASGQVYLFNTNSTTQVKGVTWQMGGMESQFGFLRGSNGNGIWMDRANKLTSLQFYVAGSGVPTGMATATGRLYGIPK